MLRVRMWCVPCLSAASGENNIGVHPRLHRRVRCRPPPLRGQAASRRRGEYQKIKNSKNNFFLKNKIPCFVVHLLRGIRMLPNNQTSRLGGNPNLTRFCFFHLVQAGYLHMLGGHLEFFMAPETARTVMALRLELEGLVQEKVGGWGGWVSFLSGNVVGTRGDLDLHLA